jgi:hypothetical protein
MSRNSYLNTYTPKFARHLHGLAVSGFYARDLDADDHEFIEQVKSRGIANGTLANNRTVLLEELEYWHLPYAIDWSIARRHGPVAMRGQGETPESRDARIKAWTKRNAERLANQKVADAELAREQAEWDAERAKRLHRALFGDAEWEAADPKNKANGKYIRRKLIPYVGANPGDSRYYVPQWKIEEQRAKEAKKQAKQQRAIADAKKQAEQAKQRAADALKVRQQAEAELAAVKRDQAERQRIEQERASGYDYDEVRATRNAIAKLIRMTYPTIWTPERLTSALGLSDVQLVVHCAQGMVRDGELKGVKVKEPA